MKCNANDTIARHKARLVAKGFHQEQGIDYFETFSPVAKQPTVRIFLTMALHYGWRIQQLDVSNAFLHDKLDEEVYMNQPHGFIDPQFPTHVCKLKKAIYGLKQAPRAWFSLLSHCLQQLGFKPSKSGPSLFVRKTTTDIIIILVYVDDFLVTGSSPSLIHAVIQTMKSRFAMKKLGSLSYFLGIETHYTPHGLLINLQKYAKDLLQRSAMSDCKPCASPTSNKYIQTNEDDVFSFKVTTLFRSIGGALQYLTITRPKYLMLSIRCANTCTIPRTSTLQQ